MSKRFTDSIAAAMIVVGLAGCASTPSTPDVAGAPPATVEGAGEATGGSSDRERRWLPDPRSVFGGSNSAGRAADQKDRAAGSEAPAVPTPKVASRNAAAFEEAIAAMQAEDWGSAERLLRKITEDQPELAGPWVNLGQVYVQLGEPEEARLAFRQAIAANPQNCAAYNQLGVLFRTQGAFDEAENHYLQCIGSATPQPEAYLNLGILYELYLGRLQEALKAYRQYQQLVPEPDRKVAGWVMDLERRTGGLSLVSFAVPTSNYLRRTCSRALVLCALCSRTQHAKADHQA